MENTGIGKFTKSFGVSFAITSVLVTPMKDATITAVAENGSYGLMLIKSR